MMNELIALDQQWLLAINGWHAPWADRLMWIISDKATWLPLYALLIALLVWRFHGQMRGVCRRACSKKMESLEWLWVLLAVGAAAGLSDWVSSGLIKHWVCRPRPTHEPALEGLVHIVNGYTGGQYGFVSSHAANTMACALLFALVYTRRLRALGVNHCALRIGCVWGGLMLWVALNCYSRMYLGVHYPGDIMGGLMVGSLVAVAVYRGLRALAAYCGSVAGAAALRPKAAGDDAVRN